MGSWLDYGSQQRKPVNPLGAVLFDTCYIMDSGINGIVVAVVTSSPGLLAR